MSVVFGMYSSLAIIPFPSIDLGEILNVAPSNIISGNFKSMLWVTKNLTPLSYSALETSSIGAALISRSQNKLIFLIRKLYGDAAA
jgi:hypothetical protein